MVALMQLDSFTFQNILDLFPPLLAVGAIMHITCTFAAPSAQQHIIVPERHRQCQAGPVPFSGEIASTILIDYTCTTGPIIMQVLLHWKRRLIHMMYSSFQYATFVGLPDSMRGDVRQQEDKQL